MEIPDGHGRLWKHLQGEKLLKRGHDKQRSLRPYTVLFLLGVCFLTYLSFSQRGLSGDFWGSWPNSSRTSLLGLDFSLEVDQELDAHCPRQGKVYGVVLYPFRRSFRNRMAFRFEMGHAILANGHRCWWVCSAPFP